MGGNSTVALIAKESTIYIASNFEISELQEIKKDLAAQRAGLISKKEASKDPFDVIQINGELTKVNKITTKINQSIALREVSENQQKQEAKFKSNNPFLFERKFLEVAQELLDAETFQEIERKANQRTESIF